MRMTRRTWARPAALVAAAGLVLAACGGGGSGADDDTDTGIEELDEAAADDEEAAPPSGDGDLLLLGWSASPAENEALEGVLADYPAAAVDLTLSGDFEATLRAALAAGDPPDVFYVDSSRFPDLVAEGVLAPTGANLTDAGDFIEALAATFTHDGQLVCPPKDFSVLALQYNVAMFEEAGLEPPTTWEELEAAAEALTTDDRAGLVVAPELARLGVFIHQAGGSVLTDDDQSNILDDASLDGLRFIERLFSEGWATTPADLDAGWSGEAFGQGRAAMAMEGNWIIGAMSNEFPDTEYATVPLPAGPAGQSSYAFTVCYGVAASSPNVEQATALVDYLTARDQLLAFTLDFPVIPSRNSASEGWANANPDAAPYVDSAEFAVGWQFPTGFQPALDDINDTLQGLADGSLTADSAAQRIDDAIADVLG